VISIKTGAVVALVGGQDFKKNQYDNAMQSARQTGSTFKPFLFAALLEKLYNEELKVLPISRGVLMAYLPLWDVDRRPQWLRHGLGVW
jgi:penicillin-binding protein 1A